MNPPPQISVKKVDLSLPCGSIFDLYSLGAHSLHLQQICQSAGHNSLQKSVDTEKQDSATDTKEVEAINKSDDADDAPLGGL